MPQYEKTNFQIKIPPGKVREDKKQGVEFPSDQNVKAAIERHPAIVHQNYMPSCLLCQNDNWKNPQTRWRSKWTGPPPAGQLRLRTPEPKPPPHGTLPALTWKESHAKWLQIVNLPSRYIYSHTALPSAECFNLDRSTQDRQHKTDCDLDMLTNGWIFTGYYTICCLVMGRTFILKTGTANWAIWQVMINIDPKTQDFGEYYDISLCIIKKQRSEQQDCKCKHEKGCQKSANNGPYQIKWMHNMNIALGKWESMECQ